MNIELFISTVSILFLLGFFIGYKKFRIPKCIQRLFAALTTEFVASTEEFTKKKLLSVLETNVDTQQLINNKDELISCINTLYRVLKRKPKKDLPDDINELKKLLVDLAVELFTRWGFLIESSPGKYRVHNFLNMLTEKHYAEARNVTRNDDILYGSYQVRHITSLKVVLLEFFPLILAFILAIGMPILLIEYPNNTLVTRTYDILNPRDAPIALRSLFILSLGILFKDVLDNIVKSYYREKYRVIVGRLSGIRYDLTYDDRLSANIRRRLVARSSVDLEQNIRQRMFSRFSSIPVGDIKIRMPVSEALRDNNPGLIDEAIYAVVDCLKEKKKELKKNIGDLDPKDKEDREILLGILKCAQKKSRKAKEIGIKELKEIFEERPKFIIRRFRNMPFPNEMYKAIKTLQLGHIRRRMKHADKILMRKGGAVASVDTRRRR